MSYPNKIESQIFKISNNIGLHSLNKRVQYILGQSNKPCAVTADPDHKITMLIGISFRFLECFSINDITLDMKSAVFSRKAALKTVAKAQPLKW